jgi:hypothetical protein
MRRLSCRAHLGTDQRLHVGSYDHAIAVTDHDTASFSGRLIVLALLVTAAAALPGCGSDNLSTEEAREAVEGIPYQVSVHEPDGESGILIGVARGKGNAIVHFAMVTDMDNDAVPSYLRAAADGNLTGGGGWHVFRDRETPLPGQSPAEYLEQVKISVAIDEALCRAATGDACPI